MRIRSLVTGVMLLGAVSLAACQGPPPTQYVLVVTATPEPTEVVPTEEPSQTPALTITPRATRTPVTGADRQPPVAVPTATFAQIQVAEQIFENGRMFWLEPIKQIWVMEDTGEGNGVWRVYEDLFEEGDPEFDPAILPPEGFLQPERGFGRLWRDNPEVREMLGWALEAELGHVSNYEYQPAGTINPDGVYVPEPGFHLVSSFYGEIFRFNEVNATWQTIRPRGNGNGNGG